MNRLRVRPSVAAMRATWGVWLAAIAAPARADSLLGVQLEDEPPSSVPPGLANLAHDDNGFHHYAVAEQPDLAVARRTVQFLTLHVARDPHDPWRLLDLAIAEIVAGSFGDQPGMAARRWSSQGRGHLKQGLAQLAVDSPTYLFVAANLLLQADWIDTHDAANDSAGKRAARDLLRRACTANRAQPRKQFLRALAGLQRTLTLARYRGFDQLGDCGSDPQNHPDGIVIEYYPDGSKRSEQEWLHDHRVGKAQMWDEDGKLR